MALAASTRPRRGLAASVVRISPRRYSAVMNIVPITITTIRAGERPRRLCSMVLPPDPATFGAMSPEPVTVNVPSTSWTSSAAMEGLRGPLHLVGGPRVLRQAALRADLVEDGRGLRGPADRVSLRRGLR